LFFQKQKATFGFVFGHKSLHSCLGLHHKNEGFFSKF